jgi:hypothetical protein
MPTGPSKGSPLQVWRFDEIEVDARPYRTGPMRFAFRPDSQSLYGQFDVPVPSVVDAYSDGFVAILPPPSAGEHVVRFGGTGKIRGELVRREAAIT